MNFNIARSLKSSDSGKAAIQTGSGDAVGGAQIDAAAYLDRYLNPPETGIPALLHYLQHRSFEPQSLKLARKAFCKGVLSKFHSLGNNCEFGLLQHKYLAEPLDLFRFSDASAAKLVQALQSGLIAPRKPENVFLQFDGPIEYGLPQLTVIVPPWGLRQRDAASCLAVRLPGPGIHSAVKPSRRHCSTSSTAARNSSVRSLIVLALSA